MTDLSQFRYVLPITVRYADVDALQHVNNAKYITYFETARIEYFANVLGWQPDDEGGFGEFTTILARVECDFKRPISWGQPVRCYLRTSRIGGKSFDFEYVLTIEDADGTEQIAAEGMTVQVAFDYGAGASMPVPDAWRTAMVAYEPGLAG